MAVRCHKKGSRFWEARRPWDPKRLILAFKISSPGFNMPIDLQTRSKKQLYPQIHRFASHPKTKKVNIFLCLFQFCRCFYVIWILFLFFSFNMDFSPESLLEMAKNVVDNNDFVNAIVLLKRGIESIKDRKGEDAKLNLIMLHMELIQVLEKVRKVYFFANNSWLYYKIHFSVKIIQWGTWLVQRGLWPLPRRTTSIRSFRIERKNSIQSQELHCSQKGRGRCVWDGVQRELWWNY